MEMKCLVLLCAGRGREEVGIPGALCARERKEMECLVLLCVGRRMEEEGISDAYLCARGRELDGMLGDALR